MAVKKETKHVYKPENQALAILKRLSQNKSAMFCLIVFIILVLMSVFAPILAPYNPTAIDFKNKLAAPSALHLFGCDELGRDILSRILYGGRYSLSLGIITVLVSLLVGVIVGALAGYFGGTTDIIIMRLLDVLSSIPGMLMAVVISAVLGTGFFNTVLALSVSSIPNFARLLRAQIMSIRDQEYLEAAESVNCTRLEIIVKHILPNSFSSLIVSATMGVAGTIMMAAGLSYVGLGVQPPDAEWGAMLSGARGFLRDNPHMVIFPGIAIAVTVLCLNTLGDGLRDALDPKLKK